MSDLETTIRHELGIPDEAQHVLMLSMDAHMDWDWQVTFQDYLTGTSTGDSAVTEIVDEAFALVAASQPAPNTYYYSICEMGFLAGAVGLNPGLLVDFAQKIGDKLRIVGGGVTSPDNLLPHGEAIIRNYLVGKIWMRQTLGLPLRQAYIPDDFGSDSQFPVLLEAMGFQGVSFSRVPGGPQQGPPATREDGGQTLHEQLVANGADFVWTAADTSSIVAHYMQNHYCQGQQVGQDPIGEITIYIATNQPSAPTPYIYVPCGCDFALPIPNLVDAAKQWNAEKYKDPATDVYVVVATLDHYNQLLSTYVDPNVKHHYGPYRPLQPMDFSPTPYWTGYYASRMQNKILHQTATRALLGAETGSAITKVLQVPDALGFEGVAAGRIAAIVNGWKSLAPSTHHDYITGTATDAVSTSEQVPLLASVIELGAGARASALQQIATQVQATPASGETPIVVFNQLGFPVSGPVSLPPRAGLVPTHVRFEQGDASGVQIGPNGEYEFVAPAPSLGYQAGYLSSAPNPSAAATGVTLTKDGASYVLKNSKLTATISESANWGLSSLIDETTKAELLPPGTIGNDLVFYIDGGGIYRFGNEYNGKDSDQTATFEVDPKGVLTAGDAAVVDNGFVRATIRTTATFTSQDASKRPISGTYIREYTLVGEEPFLRISFTGGPPLTADGAPNSSDRRAGHQYAVMVRFPLVDPNAPQQIDNLSYGTPCHWVTEVPVAYWPWPTFQATHNFLLPQSGTQVLAAIYQSTIPAWAIDPAGAMIGCVLRNTPLDSVNSHGANGQDTGTHTHHYAIRVPSGIASAADGQALQESLRMSTPLLSAFAQVPLQGKPFVPRYPAFFSLASAAPSSAMLMAAKEGTLDPAALVLRVYQPTNAPLDVTVTLANEITSQAGVQALWVTALEDEIAGRPPLPIDGSTISLTADRAIATVKLIGLRRP